MNYHNITKDDMLNGSGLRVVLWVAGCEHHCDGCQNPCTWDPNYGLLFDDDAKNELFEELSKDYISGITFSGGDPLHPNNREVILNLAKEIKNKYNNKNIWLYTGYTWDHIKNFNNIEYIDIIVDGKFNKELVDINYEWAGSTNQNIINVKERLKKNE